MLAIPISKLLLPCQHKHKQIQHDVAVEKLQVNGRGFGSKHTMHEGRHRKQ